ncbi:MAG: zinc-ribbon domain-containing protein [Saccharofermentans sp.]|nr:zinc-ribbon domain-containing protein [Saccharofermentans sp.]
MFCKHCGCEILNDSLFCENCGAKVENVPSAPQPATPVQQSEPVQEVPPVQQSVPCAAPVMPEYQAIPVTPVYPPSSVYARNAAEALQAQQAMMQQSQFASVAQPAYPPYATVTSLQPYQQPVYTQPLPGVLYDPNAEPAGSRIFLKILRIAGGVTSGLYTLLFLLSLLSDNSDKAAAYFFLLSYSVFVLIFSLCRKKIGKGAFIALTIPLAVLLYIFTNIFGKL